MGTDGARHNGYPLSYNPSVGLPRFADQDRPHETLDLIPLKSADEPGGQLPAGFGIWSAKECLRCGGESIMLAPTRISSLWRPTV